MDDASDRGPSHHAPGWLGLGDSGRPLSSRTRTSGRIVLGVFRHYEQREAGERSLADAQEALARLGPEGWETTLNRVEVR